MAASVTGSTGSAAYTWPTSTKIKTQQEYIIISYVLLLIKNPARAIRPHNSNSSIHQVPTLSIFLALFYPYACNGPPSGLETVLSETCWLSFSTTFFDILMEWARNRMPMVHSSITDHILKRSSFWLALAMPLKFGIVGKLLVRRTSESFPFRERRWHIWIMSSSQSASADWLSDSNGRSLWPISAAYGAVATTVSTVSTIIFAFFFFCNKWRPLSRVECLSGSHATLQRRRKGVAGFDTIFQHWTRFFFFLFLFTSTQLRFTSLQYGRARVTHRHHHHQSQLRQLAWLLHVLIVSTWHKRKNLNKKIKRTTSCEEVEKFWHGHCWQW